VDPQNQAALAQWQHSHQPFHWFVEFYGLIEKHGGFDVIIGNPPWKEYSQVKKEYTVHDYRTDGGGNLYGLCIERALNLRSGSGWVSFIVQLPLVSSSRMDGVRSFLKQESKSLFVIPFDDRPGKLFDGLQHCRSAIFISQAERQRNSCITFTTRYQRWPTEARPYLFSKLEYARLVGEEIYPGQFPKLASATEVSIFQKVKAMGDLTVAAFGTTQVSEHFIFYQEATQYWIKANVGLPYYAKNGVVGPPAHGRFLYFEDPKTARAVCAILNSSLFYTYFIAYGDCFHLSDNLATRFPLSSEILGNPTLQRLATKLMTVLQSNAEVKTIRTADGNEISYAESYGSKAKPILDEIDQMLAQHYGFTDEELDFIINYDVKYRMGRDAEDAEDDGEPGTDAADTPPPARAAGRNGRKGPAVKAAPARAARGAEDFGAARPTQMTLGPGPQQLGLDAAAPGPAWRVGDRVRHAAFGEGQVVAVERAGAAQTVTVQFAGKWRKQFLAQQAPLERV
jgi:hypothetical protein